jgi:alkylated DNA repair dioxygenase AlkB
MTFVDTSATHHCTTAAVSTVELPRRCVYVMRGENRQMWTHSIERGNIIAPRMVVTLRIRLYRPDGTPVPRTT